MRRFGVVLTAVMGLVIGGNVRGGDNEVAGPVPVWLGAVVTSNATSSVIDPNAYLPSGYFSLQLVATGTGTVAYVEVQANNTTTSGNWIPVYLQLANSVYTNRMFESFASNSGPSSTGIDITGFGPPLARWYRLKVYATGGAVTVSGYLAVQ